jgi:hypothetical protein
MVLQERFYLFRMFLTVKSNFVGKISGLDPDPSPRRTKENGSDSNGFGATWITALREGELIVNHCQILLS